MSKFVFPKPRDWHSLEDIIADVFSREISDPNLVRYTRFGRQGQEQHGVDVVGFNGKRLVGFQSKSHPNGKISEREAKSEIKKADKFRPSLSELIIVTSADRDKNVQKAILKESKARKAKHRFPIGILFWEDVCDRILKYPDLTYKYFTQYLPAQDLEKITLPGLNTPNRTQLSFSLDESLQAQHSEISLLAKERGTMLDPVSLYRYTNRFSIAGLNKFLAEHLEELVQVKLHRPQCDQYQLSIGFSTFPNAMQSRIVDLDLNYSHLLEIGDSQISLQKTVKALKDVQSIIAGGLFSKEITVYLQARLPYAFLFGWIFRKVTKFNLNIVSGSQLWTTKDLPHVPTGVRQNLPEITTRCTKEVVVVLNFSRSITRSVKSYLTKTKLPYHVLLDYELPGNNITSAAHALSIAHEVSLNLKSICDQWDATKIHLFMAVPSPLATLTAYHLNGIKPIHLYFYNEARTSYELAGIITNNT